MNASSTAPLPQLKGVVALVLPSAAKASNSWSVICDGISLPLAVHVDSASPHEVTLMEATLAQRLIKAAPQRLVANRAYNSDPLDRRLSRAGIEFIAPYQKNRVRPKTQGGRRLRRYKGQWKVERLNAWLRAYRKLVTQYERKPANFLGFVHLACVLIVLRKGF